MATSDAEKLQQFKNNLILEAEQLILRGLPERIVLLNEVLESAIPIPDPVTFNCNDIDVEPGSKKMRMSNCTKGSKAIENGSVPCNPCLMNFITSVKLHIKQLIEDTNLLKMWISFMIPKIEDGNNFGVLVQKQIVGLIKQIKSKSAALLGSIQKYFCSRAKVISKVAKYPYVEDYRQEVKELDEKEYFHLRHFMGEAKNSYLILHDLVTKNLEKIKNPRSNNSESLY